MIEINQYSPLYCEIRYVRWNPASYKGKGFYQISHKYGSFGYPSITTWPSVGT